MAKVLYGVETLPKISIAWVVSRVHERYRRTDGRRPIANVNVSLRSLINEHYYYYFFTISIQDPEAFWKKLSIIIIITRHCTPLQFLAAW